MEVKVVQIGNSKGIRLPKSVIEDCRIGETVELTVENGKIILNPAKKPREDWAESFKDMHKKGLDAQVIDDSLDLDTQEWTW